MRVDTCREYTRINLGENYCFNFDKAIEACVYYLAKEYWENGGGKEQFEVYQDKHNEFYSKYVARDYKRLKFALQRFEKLTENEIFDGIAYEWSDGRVIHKYYKTIETLFEIRCHFWN